ncbi:DUF3047 domain-containing protein [Agarilytica rhodophyticola]|uniref:DUF3047 domain-containing protein n=1 Tax=Agarilytica rhodophyticola TaxID=1737490 RepID=UPI000B348527|nr:DUF3047 domain-containing protein [Agarilytica rhodophyticola]
MKKLCFCLAIFLLSQNLAAFLGSELEKNGWKILTKKKVPASEFSITEDNGIKIVSPASNALIYREVNAEERMGNVLSWEWKVEDGLPSKTLKKKRGDDRPIAIYIWFESNPKYDSWWMRTKAKIARSFVGVPLQGRILTYVWGGTASDQEFFDNPHIRGFGKMIALKTQEESLGLWQIEKRNLKQDFQEAFGFPMPKIRFLALSADSEDSKKRGVAFIKNIQLSDS